MLPAFHDAHTHPVWGGLSHSRCPLYDGNSPEDYQKIIAKCAAEEPGDGWLYGVGWKDGLVHAGWHAGQEAARCGRARSAGGFANVGGHSIWVNSKGSSRPRASRATRPIRLTAASIAMRKGDAIGVLQESAVELIVDEVAAALRRKAREDALALRARLLQRPGYRRLARRIWCRSSSDEPGQAIPPGVPETYAALMRKRRIEGLRDAGARLGPQARHGADPGPARRLPEAGGEGVEARP